MYVENTALGTCEEANTAQVLRLPQDTPSSILFMHTSIGNTSSDIRCFPGHLAPRAIFAGIHTAVIFTIHTKIQCLLGCYKIKFSHKK